MVQTIFDLHNKRYHFSCIGEQPLQILGQQKTKLAFIQALIKGKCFFSIFTPEFSLPRKCRLIFCTIGMVKITLSQDSPAISRLICVSHFSPADNDLVLG